MALGEIPAAGRKRKTQFPGARGPETEKKWYHAIRDSCPQLFFFTFYGSTDRTPTGWKSRNTGGFRPLRPRTALGIGPKTEKHNFPVLGALLGGKCGRPKKFLPESAQLFLLFTFWPTRPPRAGNQKMPPLSHRQVEIHPLHLGSHTQS